MHLGKKLVSLEVFKAVELNSVNLLIDTFTYMPGGNLIKFFSEGLLGCFAVW